MKYFNKMMGVGMDNDQRICTRSAFKLRKLAIQHFFVRIFLENNEA